MASGSQPSYTSFDHSQWCVLGTSLGKACDTIIDGVLLGIYHPLHLSTTKQKQKNQENLSQLQVLIKHHLIMLKELLAMAICIKP